ncbi:MAG: glycosyltransferase [Kiritimatiellae bacterium]|nr:glycosyltransferase [Kiritimatiellia bacterium]
MATGEQKATGGGRAPFISVVMPSFRLAGQIAANIRRVDSTLSEQEIGHEIVPVDDGSGDGTDAILRDVAEGFAAEGRAGILNPVILPGNVGKGEALRVGVGASRGDLVLLLDGDLDLAPEMLPAFLRTMRETGADIVIGSKRHPDSKIDYPLSRRVASRVYYGIVRLLTGLPVTDTQVGMKLFRREAIKWAFDRMLVKRFAFDVELLAIAHDAGYRIAEAPIRMEYGSKRGSLTLENVRQVLTDTLAIFYRLRLMRYYRHVRLSGIPDPPPKVSVVIACPGDSTYLREALAGIAAQKFRAFETIVLPDGQIDLDGPEGIGLRVLPTGKVRPAEKRNIGIREACGDIVAFLDDDAAPEPQWLAQAVRHFSEAGVGASGGPAVTPPGDSRLARLGGDVYASPLVSGPARFRYTQDRIRVVDDLPSCNLLVRKGLLERIGGYSTRYWPGEDTILCLDIVNAGYQIVYDPFAVVRHHRRPLFGPHLRQVGRYALHRGFFARRFPKTSLRVSYMVPSLFVVGVVAGLPASCLAPALRPAYLGALAAYAALTFAAAFHRNPCDWLAVWAGISATHFWYGIRFIQGLLFGRMPSEVRAFDHGGEQGPPPAGDAEGPESECPKSRP